MLEDSRWAFLSFQRAIQYILGIYTELKGLRDSGQDAVNNISRRFAETKLNNY